MDLIVQYLPMDKQAQEKHSQWKVKIIQKTKELFPEHLNKYLKQ